MAKRKKAVKLAKFHCVRKVAGGFSVFRGRGKSAKVRHFRNVGSVFRKENAEMLAHWLRS